MYFFPSFLTQMYSQRQVTTGTGFALKLPERDLSSKKVLIIQITEDLTDSFFALTLMRF